MVYRAGRDYFKQFKKINAANAERKRKLPNQAFLDKSWDDTVLQSKPAYAIDYITATPPRMALYLEYSTRIYGIYLNTSHLRTFTYTPSTRYSWTSPIISQLIKQLPTN